MAKNGESSKKGVSGKLLRDTTVAAQRAAQAEATAHHLHKMADEVHHRAEGVHTMAVAARKRAQAARERAEQRRAGRVDTRFLSMK